MAHRAPSASKAKRREAPPHLKQSPTCNFQCGETVALHSSTLDEARRTAAQNASNLPRISTSDYIRLYQIISDHPRLYPIIPLHDPPTRLNSMKIELGQMGPDRRAEEGLYPHQTACPRDHGFWRGTASQLLRQREADNHCFARGWLRLGSVDIGHLAIPDEAARDCSKASATRRDQQKLSGLRKPAP